MTTVSSNVRRIAIKEAVFGVPAPDHFTGIVLFYLRIADSLCKINPESIHFILKVKSRSFFLIVSSASNFIKIALADTDPECSCSNYRIICKQSWAVINKHCFFIGFPAEKRFFNFCLQLFASAFQNLIEINNIHIYIINDFAGSRSFCPIHRTASEERFNVYLVIRY